MLVVIPSLLSIFNACLYYLLFTLAKFILNPSTDPYILVLMQMQTSNMDALDFAMKASRDWTWNVHRNQLIVMGQADLLYL